MFSTTKTKWTSKAGPRHNKAVNAALNAMKWRGQTHVEITDYGRRELVSPMQEPTESCQMVMDAIGEKYGYEITAENYRAIVADLEAATASLTLPEEDCRTTDTERAERQQRLEAQRRESEELAASAAILAKRPSWAEAVIVAELHEDDSDSMSDYHNHKVTRRVVIGWRKGKRESFPQLRKAAAQFEPTRHLGPGKDQYTIRAVWAENSPGRYKGGYVRAFSLDECSYATREPAEQAIRENEETLILDGQPVEYIIQAESYEHRENWSMGGGNYLKAGHRDESGWCVRSEPISTLTTALYEDGLPVEKESDKSETVGSGASYEIQKHYHTKREIDMWAVVLTERVERDTFETLRDSCKSAGGWFSPKWGSFPGGFCFESEAKVTAWAAKEFGSGDNAESLPKEPKAAPDAATRLQSEAEKLTKHIEDKTRPLTQNPTPKRTREYNARRHDGENLRRCQKAMHALAELHQTGTCPANLSHLRTKAQILPLVATRGDTQGYYDYRDTFEYRDTTSAGRELQALIEESPERRKERELEYKLQEVRRQEIEGYFPTPRAVAEQMIELADIQPGDVVLEPSAGTGELADVIRESVPVICCEIRPAFVEILKMKGHDLAVVWDFLQYHTDAAIDKFIMNPPFERQQDAKHIQHAYQFLASGGRIVSVMAASVKFSERYQFFRDWLADKGEIIDLPEGSFKESGTLVNTVLVVINKE